MLHEAKLGLGLLGSGLVVFATIGYIKLILSGEVKPHRVGWSIWFIATLVGTLATGIAGAGWKGLIVPVTYTAIELVVAGLAWTHYGWSKLERKWEKALLPLALALSVGWHWLPLSLGVTVAILGDIAASVYTLTKTIEDPKTEETWPWALSCLGAFLGVLALPHYGYTETAFPLYLVAQTGITTWVIWQAHKRTARTTKVRAA